MNTRIDHAIREEMIHIKTILQLCVVYTVYTLYCDFYYNRTIICCNNIVIMSTSNLDALWTEIAGLMRKMPVLFPYNDIII